MFLGAWLTIFQHWSDNGLASNRCQTIAWANDYQDLWCHIASLGLNELRLTDKYFFFCVLQVSARFEQELEGLRSQLATSEEEKCKLKKEVTELRSGMSSGNANTSAEKTTE